MFTCVGWQVTLYDPIRQVMLRSSDMGFYEALTVIDCAVWCAVDEHHGDHSNNNNNSSNASGRSMSPVSVFSSLPIIAVTTLLLIALLL